jgi:hypothetical protein
VEAIVKSATGRRITVTVVLQLSLQLTELLTCNVTV